MTLSDNLLNNGVDPIVHAAVVGYGFVFIHPFDDGNGRTHRFLIHNVLCQRKVSPEGLVLPVSAVMLKDELGYTASLEAFSVPLMKLVQYSLDSEGWMTVNNDVRFCYQFPDLTPQVDALFDFVGRAVQDELLEELVFVRNYDLAKSQIREIADMKDRDLDLFIKCCLQNGGVLAGRKRDHFSVLRDDEVRRMEEALQASFELSN